MMQGAKLQPNKKHATFTASSGRRPVLIVPGSTILLEQLDLFQGFEQSSCGEEDIACAQLNSFGILLPLWAQCLEIYTDILTTIDNTCWIMQRGLGSSLMMSLRLLQFSKMADDFEAPLEHAARANSHAVIISL